MATTLTFEIGRRPGIACRRRTIRRPALNWTSAQRIALSELVHRGDGPGNDRDESHSKKAWGWMDAMWAAVIALGFVLGVATVAEGARYMQASYVLQLRELAQPQVDITIERLPSTADRANVSANHSSEAIKRTM
jgi:hypothetical protein